jgi:alkylation response protein AidB-like acyl-CoA dehydrogenase
MRVVSAQRDAGADKPDPSSSILKIKGSEIQQQATQLLVDVAGPYAAPRPDRAEEGLNLPSVGPEWADAAAPLFFNYRKVSIYGGSNEIQRNIIAKAFWDSERDGLRPHRGAADAGDSVGKLVADAYGDFEHRKRIAPRRAAGRRRTGRAFAEMGLLGLTFPADEGGFDGGPVETMIVMEQFGAAWWWSPSCATVVLGAGLLRRAGGRRGAGAGAARRDGGHDAPRLRASGTPGAARPARRRHHGAARGGGWVLDGAKGVVLHGDSAD